MSFAGEIANLTLFNVNVEIDGNDALKKKFDEVLNALQEKQEESCSTCGMMIKSDGQELSSWILTISSSRILTQTVMYLQQCSSRTSKKETGTTQKQNITDLRM